MARRIVLALGMAVLLCVASACSGVSPTAAPSSSTSGSTAPGPTGSLPRDHAPGTAAGLHKKLLTLNDLGSGWRRDTSEDDDSGDASIPCLDALDSGELDDEDGPDAEADFVKGDGMPMLSEELTGFASATQAAAVVRVFSSVFQGCDSFSYTDTGMSAKGSFSPVTLPDLGGAEQSAFTMTMSIEGVTATGVFVAVAKHDTVMLLFTMDIGSADKALVVSVGHTALAKL